MKLLASIPLKTIGYNLRPYNKIENNLCEAMTDILKDLIMYFI